MTIKSIAFVILLLVPTNGVLGFAGPTPSVRATSPVTRLWSFPGCALYDHEDMSTNADTATSEDAVVTKDASWVLPSSALLMTAVLTTHALPAEAASTGVIPNALWAYAHFFSILLITACLAAERTLVKPDMTVDEEATIVQIDLVYGLMAALLIGSGFARATDYGKGGDFYIHETLFWVKMSLSGIWGGLSLFPSITFYRRNLQRKNEEVVPPLSKKLAARLQQIINAELSAMLSIPLVATLMARGVGYWDSFPYQVGLALSLVATIGSFALYAKQALTWTEEDDDGEMALEQ